MYLAFFRNTIERDRWINEVSVIGLSDQSFFVQTDLSIDTISLCYSDGTIELVSFTETTVTIGDKDYRKITLDSPFKCGRYCIMLTYGANFIWSEWFDAESYSFSADDIIFDKWNLPIMYTPDNVAVDLTKRNHPIFDKNFLPQWQWYAEVYAPYDIIISGQIFLVDSLGNETFLAVSGGNNYQQLLNDLSTKVISSYLGEDYTTAEGWYKYKAYVLIGVDGNPLITAFIYGYSDWFYLASPSCDYEKNLVKITLQNDTNLGSIPYYYGLDFMFKIPAYLREIEVPKTEEGESDINQFLVPTLQYHKNRYILQTGLIDSTTVDVLRTLPFWDSVIIESVTKTIFDLKDVEVSIEWQFDQKEFAVAEINMQAELIYKDILPPEYLVEFYVSNESGVISGASIEINGETLTTNASGYASINLLNGTYDYIVSKSGNYTVIGSVTVNGNTVESVSMIAGGLYTEAELDDMINNQGYIPVATGAELNNIRTNGTYTMGAGTSWVGSYDIAINTTGKNKFVMVLPISLENYQSGTGWIPIQVITNVDFVFDGNELNVTDMIIPGIGTTGRGLFTSSLGWIKNMRVLEASVSAGGINGILTVFGANMINNILTDCTLTGANEIGQMAARSGAKIYENCHVVNGTVTTSDGANVGLGFGTIAAASDLTGCSVSGEINNTYSGAVKVDYIGGLAGFCEGSISKSFTNVTINGGRGTIVGAFCGRFSGASAIVSECYALGSVTANSIVYGFSSFVSGASCSNCYSKANVYKVRVVNPYNSQIYVTGFGNVGNSTIANCYSVGLVSVDNTTGATIVAIGGFSSSNIAGTITNSYWDVETSGQALSAGGTGLSTAVMQQSAVPGLVAYILWDGAIWDAMTNVKYPELKNNYE